ncbi:carbamoyltransferase HypF [Marivivens aquimaris]|uniref:carbamoyltransferase HypF n=1 Tax=Marivivens aquimaris TaxID=2774876 RepID=UPI0018819AA6|nr:carbamoyltransferase HypF [Marivivens aquimaris]
MKTDGFEIRVRGQVQGVGFRPFVWQLAQRFGLRGEVLNDAEGVLIRCDRLDDGFVRAVSAEKPLLARVDTVEVSAAEVEVGEGFVIAASGAAGAETRVTPDAATCADCAAEVYEDGRRRGYAFTNCTHCGPRFTILKALPYDRGQTTMAPFEMCVDCAAEYADPADRRFHAQPVACPVCGPKVWMEPSSGSEPIAEAAERLLVGEIIAVKGLGGFHLCCDATNADAVAELRRRKHRPTKPLALMASMEIVERFAVVDAASEALLSDPAAPVVLLPKAGDLPDAVAPDQNRLGWMLPYTPLHHLLLDAVERPLVMTSGNLSGEPQVIGNDEAREKLGRFADAFLMHDRDIARRLDDSVERADPPMILRRARGRVPETLPLPGGFRDAPQVIAYGAHVKSAICLIKNGQALLSHHLGDLDDALTWEEFVEADADYAELFDHKPQVAACDLHPDYRSSRHAAGKGLPLVEVQHHHAHLAACLGENGWPLDGGHVAAIILDGMGLGPDQTVWGGEVLLGDYREYERAAWLRPTPLVGGDMTQKEPWRNALAQLDLAGLPLADDLFPDKPLAMARMAMEKGLNCPLSSSAGRLFDAMAACLGICAGGQSFEGEAAMTLEALAENAAPATPYPFGGAHEIDPTPLWHAVAEDVSLNTPRETMALRFHLGLAKAFADQAKRLIAEGKADTVALSGGCMQNGLLLGLLQRELDGIRVIHHTKTPANDGSIALGQALIAAAQSM